MSLPKLARSEQVRPLLGPLGRYVANLVGGIEKADHAVKLRQLQLVPGDLPFQGDDAAGDLGSLIAESGKCLFVAEVCGHAALD